MAIKHQGLGDRNLLHLPLGAESESLPQEQWCTVCRVELLLNMRGAKAEDLGLPTWGID